MDVIKVEELVDSLQTYESSFPLTKKGKSIVLKTLKEDQDDSFDEENLNYEDLDFIVRKFRKFLFPKKSNGKQKQVKEFSTNKGEAKKKNKEKSYKRDKVKYHECFGYGHIWVEWPNFKKNKEKLLNVTFSYSSESKNSASSFDEKSSFMAITTIVEEFPKVVMAESESGTDNDDLDIVVVDSVMC